MACYTLAASFLHGLNKEKDRKGVYGNPSSFANMMIQFQERARVEGVAPNFKPE